MNLFRINYSTLEKDEKKQMYYDFSQNAQKSFSEYSNRTQMIVILNNSTKVY